MLSKNSNFPFLGFLSKKSEIRTFSTFRWVSTLFKNLLRPSLAAISSSLVSATSSSPSLAFSSSESSKNWESLFFLFSSTNLSYSYLNYFSFSNAYIHLDSFLSCYFKLYTGSLFNNSLVGDSFLVLWMGYYFIYSFWLTVATKGLLKFWSAEGCGS